MTRASFHDVIVVGAEPEGLIAAGLLARQGYRVLWIGQAGTRHGYQHDRTWIPTFPPWLPPHGHAPLLDEALSQLGVEDPVHLIGNRPEPALQVVTPSWRLDLSAAEGRQARELERALPAEAKRAQAELETLRAQDLRLRAALGSCPEVPPQGLRARARLRRLASSLTTRAEVPQSSVARILQAASGFCCQLEDHARWPAVTAHLVQGMLSGMRTAPDLVDQTCDSVPSTKRL